MNINSFYERKLEFDQYSSVLRRIGPTMYSAVEKSCALWRNNIAIEYMGLKLTYGKLLKYIDTSASLLVMSGIKRGDIITVLSGNVPQAVILLYAANKLGVIVQMLHPETSSSEIEKNIVECGSKFVFVLDFLLSKLTPAIRNSDIRIVVGNFADMLNPMMRVFAKKKGGTKKIGSFDMRLQTWPDFVKNAPDRDAYPVKICTDSNAVAMILYSGGTTGTPKGVMITNENINNVAAQMLSFGGIPDYSRMSSIIIMPLFHGFGVGTCLHTYLSGGIHSFLVPKFNNEECAKLIKQKKIGIIMAVPVVFEGLMKSSSLGQGDLSAIEVIGISGDNVSVDLLNRIQRWLKGGGSLAVAIQAYGQTECTAGCTRDAYFRSKFGSIGIPIAGNAIKIVKIGTDEEVPAGEDGEICVNGPTVMKGYYKNDEETNAVLRIHPDGKTWLHTGDVGYIDEEGYLFYRQRISRMIISNGYNVYPTQVEKVITDTGLIENCCVVGAKDALGSMRVTAVIEYTGDDDNKRVIRKKLSEACRASLPEYSLPVSYIFKSRLPRTQIGKIDIKTIEDEVRKGV